MVGNDVNITTDYSQYNVALANLLGQINKYLKADDNGEVPPTSDNGTPETDDSLPNLTLPGSKLSLEKLVQSIGYAERKVGIQKSADEIKVKGDEQKNINDKQLEEIAKKLEELAKKSTLNGFLKAFQWIGAIFGTIASIVTTAVGAVTGNPVMVAAGILGMMSSIDSIVSLASDGKASLSVAFTKLGKAMGMSDEAAQKFSMGLTIGITVATMAVGITAGVKGLTKGLETASKALTTLNNFTSISTFVNSGVSLGTAGLQIGSAVVDYKIAKTEISQKEFEAMLEQLREAQKMLKEFVEAELERNSDLMGKVKDIIDDVNQTQIVLQTAAPATMA